MKVLIEIKDSKADVLLQLLNDLPYVKTAKLPTRQDLRADIIEAVEEMKLIKAGKKKGKDAEQFLNAL